MGTARQYAETRVGPVSRVSLSVSTSVRPSVSSRIGLHSQGKGQKKGRKQIQTRADDVSVSDSETLRRTDLPTKPYGGPFGIVRQFMEGCQSVSGVSHSAGT